MGGEMLGSITNACSLRLRLVVAVAVGPRSKPKPPAKPPVSWSTFVGVGDVSATTDGLISGKDAIN